MEDAFALVVLTLLQLCRAEITNTEWYAANLINDPNFTPKPLTEIFTTDLNFTPRIPTISTEFFTRTTPPVTTDSTTVSSSTPPTTTNENRETSTQGQTRGVPFQIVGFPVPQQPQTNFQLGNNQKNELSSFVLIYDPRQQAGQIFQQSLTPRLSTVIPSAVTETQSPTTTQTSTTATQSTTQTNTQGSTILSRNLQTQNIPLTQPIIPTSFVPGQWGVRNIVYPIPNFPVGNNNCNTTNTPEPVTASSTLQTQTVQPVNSKPIFTVRLKSPKGSITNIRINPTTTKKPTTTRRRKSNKKTNDYEICLSSCDGKKEPICSGPIGVFPIDPDRLKGFASLCHMACHNSFRKDQVYEKVADGRCGRLRTRIRPVDKNKLNREELNKAQYTILHNGPETVMEFSSLKR
ncbi:salivary glue protein Sgs-3-like [Melitaea cinxia]|uniref:salivary glue protein Sgs-3-like n=1 Tax=Melitaea cinxia TaxID=113334 RepID=UPI001E2714D0|nr:salivary glue protein Sgs-3-like [Melitaea cinxia]